MCSGNVVKTLLEDLPEQVSAGLWGQTHATSCPTETKKNLLRGKEGRK